VTTSRRPLVNTLAIGMVAVLGLSACTSDPSAERVAEDLVKTLTQDHPEIEECMLDKVLEEYDLSDLGEKANSENSEISGPALAELDRFEADLVACDPEGVTRTGTP
jgi:uncharacterized lipoprotein